MPERLSKEQKLHNFIEHTFELEPYEGKRKVAPPSEGELVTVRLFDPHGYFFGRVHPVVSMDIRCYNTLIGGEFSWKKENWNDHLKK